MRYLFHMDSLTLSGGSKVTVLLLNALAHRGHSVTVVVDRNRVGYHLDERIDVYYLNAFGRSKKVRFEISEKVGSSKGTKALAKEKSSFKKSIVSIREWFKYFFRLFAFPLRFYYARQLFKKIDPELLVSTNMYRNFENFFLYNGFRLFLTVHNDMRDVFNKRIAYRIFPISFYLKGVKCIFVADGVRESSNEFSFLDIEQSKVIYNPFVFPERSDSLPSRESYFVNVSTMSKKKGVDRVVKAFSIFCTDNPDDRRTLKIVGDGPEMPRLRQLVSDLDLTTKVEFLGFLPDATQIIRDADCLLHGSHTEALPTVLIEALSLGVPAVCTDCDYGPREILTGDLSRFLVAIKSKDESDICTDMARKMALAIAYDKPVDVPKPLKDSLRLDYVIQQWESL